MQRYNFPLDPHCPVVEGYMRSMIDDPIMRMSGCADEFARDFELSHRARCARCIEYGVANVEVA